MGFIDKTKIQTEVNLRLLRNEKVVDERVVTNVITNLGLCMIADRVVAGTLPIVNKITIGKSDEAATTLNIMVADPVATLAAPRDLAIRIETNPNTGIRNVVVYEATFAQRDAYGVKEAGLLSSTDVLYARTTFPVINKGVNDTLKITWKWTIQ